jgi:hypothetical protein
MGDQCEQLVGKTNDAIDDSVEEREKFVHLAGIGLMTGQDSVVDDLVQNAVAR